MKILANSALTSDQADLINTLNRAIPGFRALVPGQESRGELGFGDWLVAQLPNREEKLGVAGLTEADPAMTSSAITTAIAGASISSQDLARARITLTADDAAPTVPTSFAAIPMGRTAYADNITAAHATCLFTATQAGDYVVEGSGATNSKNDDIIFGLYKNGTLVETLNWGSTGGGESDAPLLRFAKQSLVATDTLQVQWIAATSDPLVLDPAQSGVTNAQATNLWFECNQLVTKQPT